MTADHMGVFRRQRDDLHSARVAELLQAKERFEGVEGVPMGSKASLEGRSRCESAIRSDRVIHVLVIHGM